MIDSIGSEIKALLSKVRFVLVETTHPGNIGSTARALKTMNCSNLYLVNPKEFPNEKADALAVHAKDILDNAKVCSSLLEAVQDCSYVVATTARARSLDWNITSSQDYAIKLLEKLKSENIAIVFGREKSGLTNEEMQLCDLHVYIPANEEYSSLNLASAIQILAYELNIKARDMLKHKDISPQNKTEKLATKAEVSGLLDHTNEALASLKITSEAEPKLKLLSRIKRIYTKASLLSSEVDILRGIFAAVIKKIS